MLHETPRQSLADQSFPESQSVTRAGHSHAVMHFMQNGPADHPRGKTAAQSSILRIKPQFKKVRAQSPATASGLRDNGARAVHKNIENRRLTQTGQSQKGFIPPGHDSLANWQIRRSASRQPVKMPPVSITAI